MDYWLEQATLMVQEGEWPERDKRRRLLESLRGPALEIVQALRLSEPDARSEAYLEALDRTFGSAESGEDLYFSFRLIQQKAGEKVSDYARRLEPILTKVVKRGGILAQHKDRVRIEQLLRGTVGADLMLLQLRLKDKGNPPNFLDLLSEIRIEEDYERTRHKVNTRVRRIDAQDELVTE